MIDISEHQTKRMERMLKSDAEYRFVIDLRDV